MGLDMYLRRKSYIMGKYNPETGEYTHPVTVTGIPLLDGGKNLKEISEEAAYWRKANQIHNWFVENVQDGEDECNPYDVTLEQLQKLVDTCKEVLADHSKAEELIPSTSGFFFGGTDYDEYYYQYLQNTVDQLEPLIAFEKDENNAVNGEDYSIWVSYEYQSSW